MSTQGNKLTAIADAIREMDGTTAPIKANDFPDRIRAIETGVDTSDATATAEDILLGETAYVNGEKVTGTIPTVEQATPSITVSNSGLITASATQTSGFVTSGSKSATEQLTAQAAKVWTPTTSGQSIPANTFLTGTQTIRGDSNLVASNIKEGVTIFGITGTVSEGVDTSDATATANTIRSGYTAYVNGQKITGTVPTQDSTTITPGTSQKTAVASGRITTGNVYVAGSSNLVASNIKSGVSIFGVSGNLVSGNWIDLSPNATSITGKNLYFSWTTPYTLSRIKGIVCYAHDESGSSATLDQYVTIARLYAEIDSYGSISGKGFNYAFHTVTSSSSSVRSNAILNFSSTTTGSIRFSNNLQSGLTGKRIDLWIYYV